MVETVLVTGAAGYIGSHTVVALRNHGYSVVAVDRRTPAGRSHSAAPFVQADIGNERVMSRTIRDYSVTSIVHLAGDKSVEHSLRHPADYFRNNVCGTLKLLRAMDRTGVRQMIFSSSCAVYGNPDSQPVTEETEPRPLNPYGESKLIIERMLRWFDACVGLRFVSLRYFNAAGASPADGLGEDWEGASNLIPVLMRAVLLGDGPVRVFGSDYPTPDGTAVRDYVHVADLAMGHVMALRYLREGRQSATVNLGSGQGSSVLEVIAALRAVSGRRIRVERAPPRPGDPAAIWAANSKAADLLGWRPRFTLNDIVASAWSWHGGQSAGAASKRGTGRSSLPRAP